MNAQPLLHIWSLFTSILWKTHEKNDINMPEPSWESQKRRYVCFTHVWLTDETVKCLERTSSPATLEVSPEAEHFLVYTLQLNTSPKLEKLFFKNCFESGVISDVLFLVWVPSLPFLHKFPHCGTLVTAVKTSSVFLHDVSCWYYYIAYFLQNNNNFI